VHTGCERSGRTILFDASKAARRPPALASLEIERLEHCSYIVRSSFSENTVRGFLGLDGNNPEDMRQLAGVAHWQ
jgi:hypothetical protein